MFGWFTPSCPVALRDKIWVEQRLPWLFERFGTKRILAAPRILPTREHFPEVYQGKPEDLPALFERVCQYMGADSKRFELQLFTEEDRQGALGLYQRPEADRPTVWLLKSLLPDQEAVISTLAHEVAHDLLLGADLVTGDESDHEELTDLLPVVLGMGTFHANTAIKQKSWHEGNMSFWQISRSGYLTASVCGYAMGVIEYLRRSRTSPSVAYLGTDAAVAMRSGHKYLQKTNDCLIDVDRPERPIAPAMCQPPDYAVRGSASRCLFALESWLNTEITSPKMDAALFALQRKEPEIQCAAIAVLEQLRQPSDLVIGTLLQSLYSPHHTVRQKATTATGTLCLPMQQLTNEGEPLVEALLRLTSDLHTETAVAAAVVLGTYGPDALVAAPKILPLLVTAIIRQSDAMDPILSSLNQIAGNLKLYLQENPNLLSESHHELIRHHLRARPTPRSIRARSR